MAGSFIQKTDAIVLGARRYSESSKIVWLFTRQHGKVSVMARGAMQPKNRFGSVLQPMAVVSATIYFREGRELQTISDAEVTQKMDGMMGDLDAISAGMTVVELVNALMHDAEVNHPIYDLAAGTLRTLNDKVTSPALVVAWFSVRIAGLTGYAITPDRCGVCDEPVAVYAGHIGFSLPVGAPLCAQHAKDQPDRGLSAAAYLLLNDLCALYDPEQLRTLDADNEHVAELSGILASYIQYHVQGLRRLRVRDVAAQLTGPG